MSEPSVWGASLTSGPLPVSLVNIHPKYQQRPKVPENIGRGTRRSPQEILVIMWYPLGRCEHAKTFLEKSAQYFLAPYLRGVDIRPGDSAGPDGSLLYLLKGFWRAQTLQSTPGPAIVQIACFAISIKLSQTSALRTCWGWSTAVGT